MRNNIIALWIALAIVLIFNFISLKELTRRDLMYERQIEALRYETNNNVH